MQADSLPSEPHLLVYNSNTGKTNQYCVKVYIKWIHFKEKKRNNGYTIQDKDRLPLGYARGLLPDRDTRGLQAMGEKNLFLLSWGGGCMGVHFTSYQAQYSQRRFSFYIWPVLLQSIHVYVLNIRLY